MAAAALLCVAAASGAWTAAAAGPAATADTSRAADTPSASGTSAAAGAAASTDDPRTWLLRAYRALDSRNYRGVFVHEFAGETETLRVVHRVGPDGLGERLQSMDGSGREFIRQGSLLYCYLPDRHMVVVERSPDAGPLLSGLLSPEGPISGQYRVRQVSRTRALGRMTRVIAIEPMDQLRYGYRVWIDEATAMPVRMQLRGERGRVLEQIVFTELVLPAHIAPSELVPALNARNYRWVQQDPAAPTLPNVPDLSIAWQASALPPGFRMTVNTRQMLPGGPAEHLVFSDGMASVSVFVQLRRNGSPTLPSEDSASLGTSSAYTVLLQNYRVTVVGQVPPQTVRDIASAFRSAAPAPAFADSGLGVPTALGGGPGGDAATRGVPMLLPGLDSHGLAVPGVGAAARSRVGFGVESGGSALDPALAGTLARPATAPSGPHRH